MTEKVIKFGACQRDEGHYSFDVYRLVSGRRIKTYIDQRIAWSQSPTDLGHSFISLFSSRKQDLKEYTDAERIEVIPLLGIGNRPAYATELGNLVSSIAEITGTPVLLHAKAKKLEEIK